MSKIKMIRSLLCLLLFIAVVAVVMLGGADLVRANDLSISHARAAQTDMAFGRYGGEEPDYAIDGNGGHHVIYSDNFGSTKTVYYRYCATTCTVFDNWSDETVILYSEDAESKLVTVRLQVTKDGKPRIMTVYQPSSYNATSDWYYSECDVNCHQGGNWHLVELSVNSAFAFNTYFNASLANAVLRNSDWFTLTSDGNPRFVYTHAETQLTWIGTDFVTGRYYRPVTIQYWGCNDNCANANSWTNNVVEASYVLDPVYVGNFALTLDSNDLPRFLMTSYGYGDISPSTPHPQNYRNESDTLFYYECSADCDGSSPSWTRTDIWPEATGTVRTHSFVMRLDSQNQPRVMMAGGYSDGNGGIEPDLTAFHCNSNCSNASNWSRKRLIQSQALADLPSSTFHGEAIDMQISKDDIPHIVAYTSGDIQDPFGNDNVNRIRHIVCTAMCDDWNAATWVSQEIANFEHENYWGKPELDGCPFISGTNTPWAYCWNGGWDYNNEWANARIVLDGDSHASIIAPHNYHVAVSSYDPIRITDTNSYDSYFYPGLAVMVDIDQQAPTSIQLQTISSEPVARWSDLFLLFVILSTGIVGLKWRLDR